MRNDLYFDIATKMGVASVKFEQNEQDIAQARTMLKYLSYYSVHKKEFNCRQREVIDRFIESYKSKIDAY